MKKVFILTLTLIGSLASTAFAEPRAVELPQASAKLVGNFLREAEKTGESSVYFEAGPQVTTYSVGNLFCYFQNSDDSVSCSTEEELSPPASEELGRLLRSEQLKGNKDVSFEGGQMVTVYSIPNVACYFQNSDDSVSCSAASEEP